MDLATCFKKMELVGVLAFATVDSEGAPQIRNISAIHYERDALYFFTARGKNFCRQLQADGRVQILCYTKYKEMIRLSGKAVAVAEEEQAKWRDRIFAEQPYLANVYPGDTREIRHCILHQHGAGRIFQSRCQSNFQRDIYTGKCYTGAKGIFHNRCLYRLRNVSEKLPTEMHHGREAISDSAGALPALWKLL